MLIAFCHVDTTPVGFSNPRGVCVVHLRFFGRHSHESQAHEIVAVHVRQCSCTCLHVSSCEPWVVRQPLLKLKVRWKKDSGACEHGAC